MAYCPSRFRTVRRRSAEVRVGSVGVGGDHPIRIQSMTTSDTQDIEATVRQSIALAEVGCEIVRITAPNVQAARCLKDIRARFTAAGFGSVPIVADIHFLPQAAMEAALHVEKVRVNPGNYADKKRFAVREYSDAEYDRELGRLDEAFSPLVLRCRELGRAMRIGTNHGSLSDRIMNRYGDTPLGMVESALEFLRIAERHGYRQIVLSMKASNPKVMIEAYRLLVERMQAENMHYPLHLGVTEAGDGEDGRIKGAIGIGSLLFDGLGDTIRVSLTEDSVYEIPVARALAEKAMSLWTYAAAETGGCREAGAPGGRSDDSGPARAGGSAGGAGPTPTAVADAPAGPGPHPAEHDSLDPFHYARRPARPLALGPGCVAGGDQPPRVVVRAKPDDLANPTSFLRHPRRADTPAEGLLLPVASDADLRAIAAAWSAAAREDAPPASPAFLVLELGPAIPLGALEAHFGPASAAPGRTSIAGSKPSAPSVAAGGATPGPSAALGQAAGAPGARPGIVLLRRFGPDDAEALAAFAAWTRGRGYSLACDATPAALAALAPALRRLGPDRLLVAWSGGGEPADPRQGVPGAHAVGVHRALVEELRRAELPLPLWIRNTAPLAARGDNTFLSRLLEASILTGALLCDGLGDLVSVETEPDAERATRLAYNLLQGAGARVSKTEFVACPSCGRTLFDLQTTTQRIRARTGHLKGVKIAIMGCIVNGPGEMADADFGYVGGAPGKINLYVGKQCVQYNVPQAEADERLIALIREYGKWAEPSPVPA